MQLGRIHVGPGGFWLIIAGLTMTVGIEPVDLPAQIAVYAGVVGAVLGTASVLTWCVASAWRNT